MENWEEQGKAIRSAYLALKMAILTHPDRDALNPALELLHNSYWELSEALAESEVAA